MKSVLTDMWKNNKMYQLWEMVYTPQVQSLLGINNIISFAKGNTKTECVN